MGVPPVDVPSDSAGLDITAARRELALRERELAARERELAAKESESKRPWLNPTRTLLIVAILGLVGNVIVAIYNASATRQSEQRRNRAALITELAKIGDPDGVLKNLKWFSDRNLVDDPDGALRQAIYGKTDVPVRPVGPSGPESLPLLPPTGLTGSISQPGAMLDRAQFLRRLSNPNSRLQVKLTVNGCCVEAKEMRIQVQNLSQVPLYVLLLGIDSTSRIEVLFPTDASPHLLQPNEIITQTAMAAAPFPDVMRVIGSKTPITPSNFDRPALRKLDPSDWCTQAQFFANVQERLGTGPQ